MLVPCAAHAGQRGKKQKPQQYQQVAKYGQKIILDKNVASYVTFSKPAVKSSSECPVPPPSEFIEVPPQNPNAYPGAFYPDPNVSNLLQAPPQTVGLTFVAGKQGLNPGFQGSPPDTNGVKGPTQFVMCDNNGAASFTSEGKRDGVLDLEVNSLFNADGDFSIFNNNSDARIRYDAHSDRYYGIFLNPDRRTGSTQLNFGFSLAISDSGVLTDDTKWTVVNIFNADVIPDANGCPGDQDTFYDFPNMGIDKDAVYVGMAIFGASEDLQAVAEEDGPYNSASLFVFQKSSLLSDGPAVINVFRDVLGSVPVDDYSAHTTIQPAMNFDSDSKYGYVIGTNPYMFGSLVFFRVLDPGSESPSITPLMPIDVLTTACADFTSPIGYPPFQGNLYGDVGLIESFDERLQMAHVINNQIYAAHNIQVDATGVANINGDRVAARWYQLDLTGDSQGKGKKKEKATTVPALVQAGTLFDPSPRNPLFYSFSAIMSNKRGDISLCGTVSGVNLPPCAFYTGRLNSDPLGALRIGANPPSVYATGSLTYTRGLNTAGPGLGQRWGDMTYTSLDPVDRMTMWTIQEIITDGVETKVVAKLVAP